MTRYTPIKIALIIGLVWFALYAYFNNGLSSKTFEEVAEAVERTIDTDTLVKTDSETGLKKYYGLVASDYEGTILYMAGSNVCADELLLVKVADDDQAEEVMDAIDERIASRTEVFRGYMPDEAAKLDEAVVIYRGGYVFFAASDKADDYMIAFERSL